MGCCGNRKCLNDGISQKELGLETPMSNDNYLYDGFTNYTDHEDRLKVYREFQLHFSLGTLDKDKESDFHLKED